MAGMGPPPKAADQRARRNASVAMTALPAGGRQGDPPPWPLPNLGGDVTDVVHEHEVTLWAELWATPQAVQWERLRWTREVAQYVRWKALAEFGSLDAGKEARQLADRLGLSPLSLLRLRWEIIGAPEVEAQVPASRGRAKARSRYKVLAGGGDAVAGA
jgi:hypothetical protein